MFRFLELSLHGWDLWQQVRVPLDRDVVLVTGPNGSGKTTLLDAIRQLLGARKLSSRRRLQNYLRNPHEPALIRAVVSNRSADGAFPPFRKERLGDAEVTLACALVPAPGGAPEKRFAILGGRPPITDVQRFLLDGRDYYQPERYERALANAGVTRSLMSVLSIEQGRTNQLFERSARDLFREVLDMLGDKAVLDRYADARRRYAEAEAEVLRQVRGLLHNQAELEGKRREVQRLAEWEEAGKKVAELDRRLPAAEYQAHWKRRSEIDAKLNELRTKVRNGENEKLGRARAVQDAEEKAASAEAGFQAAKEGAENAAAEWNEASAIARAAEETVQRLEVLKDETARLPVGNLDTLQTDYAQASRAAIEAAIRRDERLSEVSARANELAKRRDGVPQYPEAVAATLVDLKTAGIQASLLCQHVADVDGPLAEAAEAALGDARFALLVEPADEPKAIEIALAWKFPGPIYAGERITDESTAGPLRFKAGAPTWIAKALESTELFGAGKYRNERGIWVSGAMPRLFGRSATDAAVESAARQFEEAKDILAAAEQLCREREQEATKLTGSLAIEQRRRNLLGQIAPLEAEKVKARELLRASNEKSGICANLNEARDLASAARAEERTRAESAREERDKFERQLEGFSDALVEHERQSGELSKQLAALRPTLGEDLRLKAETGELDGPDTVRADLGRAKRDFESLGDPPPPEVRIETRTLEANVTEMEKHVAARKKEAEQANQELLECRARYLEVVDSTLREYRARAVSLGKGADVSVEMELPVLRNDDVVLDEAEITVRFGFDGKEPLPMGDASFSGGQQVVAGLILLMSLVETDGHGFFLLDEPFAHLSIDRIDQVGRFLRGSGAQFLITAPTTLDRAQLDPAATVLVFQKKRATDPFAPPPVVAVA